jgi:putative glutamine amidotransferase
LERKPLLGIIACNRSIGAEIGAAVAHRYLEPAIRFAEATVLVIPSIPDLQDAADAARALDGVLLTGSPSNVRPSRFGRDDPGEAPHDDGRDETALHLIDAMTRRGRPVFGICRGFQEVNVAFGGTLRPDMARHPDLIAHHAADHVGFDDMFDHRHPVELVPGGVLATAYDRTVLDVRSVHFQGVERLGSDLSIEARAPDGVIEAVSARVGSSDVLAVQWHPEWRAADDPDSQVFFRLLGRALRGERLPTSA